VRSLCHSIRLAAVFGAATCVIATALVTPSARAQEVVTPTPAPEPTPAPPPAVPPAEAPPAAAPSQTSNYFNPSISVIGNFLGVAGHNPVENLPNLSLRESEVGLQSIVDPYARADFFLSFNGSNVDVEEGYLTFTTLPGQFLAKVGRMRVQFGKINTLHLHVLPWPDEPLPIVNLLGGEEGWIGDGISVSHLIPMPGDLFSELTGQLFNGDAGELFSAPHRKDVAWNFHYRAYGDLSEASNLELGFSYGEGPNSESTDDITRHTRLEAIDATFRWKPLQQGLYKSASIRAELFRSRRDQVNGLQTSRGWFVSGEYQLAKRWFTGVRFEESDRATDEHAHDSGQALNVTFWPSEFSQLRGELRRRKYGPEHLTANEALLQLQFAIGAHGAHPF
jgi:hypothetical protein